MISGSNSLVQYHGRATYLFCFGSGRLTFLYSIPFARERRFCQTEKEITLERERKRLHRELDIWEATAANELEECSICLSVDRLSAEMASCQSGHRFCRTCVRRVVRWLAKCDMVVEKDQLQKLLLPHILYKPFDKHQVEEMTVNQVKQMVRCPFCPYYTMNTKMKDKLLNCLNPASGKVSCRLCNLSNHFPLSCKKINFSRRKVEEKLTMSRVRQCWD